MAIERSLQTLDLYDLLTDLIPGAVLLLFGYLVVDTGNVLTDEASSIVALGAIVGAFVFGHVIQWARNWCLWQQPRAFQHTMNAVRAEKGDGDGCECSDRALDVIPMYKAFLDDVDDYFDLEDPGDTERFKLVLSYLETRPSTRTSRFQSLYSFHRSMYVASIFGVLLALIALLLSCQDVGLFRPDEILISTGAVAFVFALATRSRRDKFEKVFVSYAIREYHMERTLDEKTREDD